MPEAACLAEPAFWLQPDREQEFARLRHEAPVSRQAEPDTIWSSGGRGFWAVVRHADVRHVSRRTDIFVSGLGTELFDLPVDVARAYSGILNMDAPEHTRMRGLITKAFSPQRIRQLDHDIRRQAREIVDAVSGAGGCDFATEIADALPTAVTCGMLGVPLADRATIARLSRAAVPLGDPEFQTVHDPFEAAQLLIDYGRDLVAERRRRPVDDLMGLLAGAEIEGESLDEAAAGTFFELLVTAGIETTGAAIAQGFLALCENPDQRTFWRNDFEGVAPKAIEEILRWSTPVVHFRRTALVDTEIAGQPIAAGDKVVIFYNSANRDEIVFDDPYRFDLMRSTNPHMTFGGGGPHFCLGAHLARLEMKVIFQELFERLPDANVAGTPVLMHSMFFNGVKALPCAFTPAG